MSDSSIVEPEARICLLHRVQGCKQCVMLPGLVAALEPRVTRTMVDVGESLRLMTDVGLLIVCGQCGAALPHMPSDDVFVERHRAWHDRLERLLEARSS